MDGTFSGAGDVSLITVALIVGIIVLCIAALLWFLRRRRHVTFTRGGSSRRPRLAVLDAAAVDTHRRLVLVRRDNVEHLILIGGPSDLVVERGIDRAPAKAQRDQSEQKQAAIRPSAVSAPPRETETIRKPSQAKAKPTIASDSQKDVEPQRSAAMAKPKSRPMPLSRKQHRSVDMKPAVARGTPPAPGIQDDRAPTPEALFGEASGKPTASPNDLAPEPDALISEIENMLDAVKEPPEPAVPVKPVAPGPDGEVPASPRKRPSTVAKFNVSIDPVPAPAPPPEGPAASPEELIADFDRALEADFKDIEIEPVASEHSGTKGPEKRVNQKDTRKDSIETSIGDPHTKQ